MKTDVTLPEGREYVTLLPPCFCDEDGICPHCEELEASFADQA